MIRGWTLPLAKPCYPASSFAFQESCYPPNISNLDIGILVGCLEHFIFPSIGNFIIPTDELIFSRGAGRPPTSVWRFIQLSRFYQKSKVAIAGEISKLNGGS